MILEEVAALALQTVQIDTAAYQRVLGDELRSLRKQRGWTRKELNKRLAVPPESLANLSEADQRTLRDILAEPHRAPLVPGFSAALAARIILWPISGSASRFW